MNIVKRDAVAIDVLLVEDSAGDVRLTREALLVANSTVRLHVVRDGVDAMSFLRRQGVHEFLDALLSVLSDTGFDAHLLELELTESVHQYGS